MPSASSNPVAVRDFAAAPAKEGGRVKIGQYVFAPDKTATIYVAESVLKESLSGPAPIDFKPRLKPGVDANKPRFTVDDFQGNFTRPECNMLFDVYTTSPKGDAPGRVGQRFKFKPADRSFSHGSAYGGPIETPDGTLIVRFDRTCREVLHWIMKRVDGFQDLFFEESAIVARLSAKAEAPIRVAADKTFEDLDVKPRHRPVSPNSQATRIKLANAPTIDSVPAAEKAGWPNVPARFTVTLEGNQKNFTIRAEGPEWIPVADVLEYTKQLQAGMMPDLIDETPIEQIMPTQRMLDYIGQVIEGGLIDREPAIRYATEGRHYPASRAWERCIKRFERIVAAINDGSLAEDLGLPTFTYRLEQEQKPAQVGVTNDGFPPTRVTVFYRKQALEAEQEMQVLR